MSRALSETETRYAQIDKEILAVTVHGHVKSVVMTVLGLSFVIKSDHKPHIPLFNTKCLNSGYCDSD